MTRKQSRKSLKGCVSLTRHPNGRVFQDKAKVPIRTGSKLTSLAPFREETIRPLNSSSSAEKGAKDVVDEDDEENAADETATSSNNSSKPPPSVSSRLLLLLNSFPLNHLHLRSSSSPTNPDTSLPQV